MPRIKKRNKITNWILQIVITKIYGCKLSDWYCRWCGAKWDEPCKTGCIGIKGN